MANMDEQVIDLLRDQHKQLSDNLDDLKGIIREHVDEDKRYWQKIDKQEAQIGLVKGVMSLFGGSSVLAFLAWFYNQFVKH